MDIEKLNNILDNFKNIEHKLSNLSEVDMKDYAKLSKEYADLKPMIEKINVFLNVKKELKEVEDLLGSEDSQIKNEYLTEKNALLENKKLIEE